MKKIIIGILGIFLITSCNEVAQDLSKEQTNAKEYEYVGGYPTEATLEKAYFDLDVQRASQAYLEFISLSSMNSLFRGHEEDYGMTSAGDVGIYIQQGTGKAGAIGLTYNTESIYASANTDLKVDGPTVIETPPNVLGVVNSGFMAYITDLGNAGPDKGKGGKYLLVPTGYEGDIPEGYFVYEVPTNKNWVMVRGFTQETGTGEDALEYYKENFKIYPLSTGPRENAKYVSMTGAGGNTTHPRDASYFTFLDKLVQYEPTSAFTSHQLGLLKAISIEKGKAFNPDARMKKVYEEGVKKGEAFAKAIAFAHRDKEAQIYDDRNYELIFVGGSHEFNRNGIDLLDAKTLFHYTAIVVTPAMAKKMVGVGSQYLAAYRDADNDYLMGETSFKLRLPKGIPAKNFWSVTVYDADTRSLLQNGEDKPSVSMYDEPEFNEDGSIDIYFGPELPKGAPEKNWVKTVSGQGWFLYIRLYGPLEAYFDKTWKPEDIVKIN